MANLKGMIASRMGLGDAFGDVVSPLSRQPTPCPPSSASKTTSELKESLATKATKGDETEEVGENVREGEKDAPKDESQEILMATPNQEVEEVPATKGGGRGRGRGRGRGGSLKRPASSAPKPSTFKRPAAATAPPEAPPAEVVNEGGSAVIGGDGVDTVVQSNGTLLATYGNWQA